ncbi:MAG: LysM peptidoglycan-binding domain-containing protein [Calditrichaeota bacterium]|nr:LysM peptidoglycan-binding domain-containing protein [Calditrichota bacterium]MCB9391643.1 LysM peptidoglycan-binding domain-containing protein [Calditrichota bacterium]
MMSGRRFFLLALFLALWTLVGCTASTQSGQRPKSAEFRQKLDQVSQPTDREKWSLARKAYTYAMQAHKHKQSDEAAYFYEASLALLGDIDLASVDVEMHRVASFNRRVLESYDQFVADLKSLPPASGLVAVIEAGEAQHDEEEEDDAPEEVDVYDISSLARPVPELDVVPAKPMLPRVPMEINSKVRNQIHFFQTKGNKVMLRWMERAATIFPRMRPILREEGIPDDLLYLSMIESGLNLNAYSYAHAAGLWQFIPGTGRNYGLHIDRSYDERRHVELATRAACGYLRTLYEMFGDWYLAMAAYNCGEGRIAREIKRYNTKDYWKMHKLPRQTRGYVPTYLAARAICEDPERYGFPQLPPEQPFECERIYVNGGYKLDDVARAAGHDPQSVKDLNPEYLKGVIPDRGQPMLVRLPGAAAEAFDQQLAEMPKTIIAPTSSHRVRKGETLSKIAAKYGTSVAAIMALPENKRVKARSLRVGQEIVIPVAEVRYASEDKRTVKEAAKDKQEPRETVTQTTDRITYTVHRGESLGSISRRLGVSVDQICRENGIKNPNKIQPGQKLNITVKGEAPRYADKSVSKSSKTAEAVKRYYTVQSGDTVWSIAQAHGVDANTIMKLNRLGRKSKIYPGQRLVVSN